MSRHYYQFVASLIAIHLHQVQIQNWVKGEKSRSRSPSGATREESRVLNANKKGDVASLRLSFDGGRPRVASRRISTILSPPLIRTRQRILPTSPEFCITRLFSSYREFERVNAATRAFDGNSEIHFSSATSRDFRMNRRVNYPGREKSKRTSRRGESISLGHERRERSR